MLLLGGTFELWPSDDRFPHNDDKSPHTYIFITSTPNVNSEWAS
jgi:hypothetical protein